MENASKVMYQIARIFAFVLLGICCLLITLDIIWLIVHAVRQTGVMGDVANIVGHFIWLSLILVMLILGSTALKNIDSNYKDNGPHIVCIVVGAISGNIFFLLGGIFALVAIGQSNNETK